MTTHYIELKAIPQMDMLQSEVIGHCMQILHQFLPHFEGRVGVAFPAYGLGRNLGGIVRLFANQEDCNQLHQQLLRSGLSDYALISEVSKTPLSTECRSYSRVHRKGQSAIRRTEKRLKSQGRWDESIRADMQQRQQNVAFFPHCHLKSASTGQRFILAVKENRMPQSCVGVFNAYGLSNSATVPHF
ncbi:type I-F CRISPR-associated endoribonuclease Cas6/Csy4 [Pasteurella multocida]|uniref:type I-F CRISPR-associated endoribonuclease Cas6/Csy4 n=1 Tax=Pasteurella multocida TaxID=747 RepID=UPI0018979416|nr:type I-F CRISPR-associated endoribonuclease Cas6/Csy4 [Pasteurella multocida]MBF6979967.1 type I-F CRISPR-associated endoribonuclease Cas6/Csy4 [Pasteurella multocida]